MRTSRRGSPETATTPASAVPILERPMPAGASGRDGRGAASTTSQGEQDQKYLRQLGHRLKAQRTAAGMTQQQLAERAGMDRTYVGRLEHGQHSITVLVLNRLALALGVAAGELLDSAVEDDDRFAGLRTRRPAEQ